MQRFRRRYIVLLIFLLLLLLVFHGRFAGSLPAKEIESPAPTAIAEVDAYQWPHWRISSENFWELLELFSQRFSDHGERPIEGVSISGGDVAANLPSPIWIASDPPQMVEEQYVLNQPPLLFFPDQPASGGAIASVPGFFFSSGPDFPRAVSSPPIVQPPTSGQTPPTVGDLPPTSLPEPAVSLLLLLIPLRRRS
jgi:hypothetical protein